MSVHFSRAELVTLTAAAATTVLAAVAAHSGVGDVWAFVAAAAALSLLAATVGAATEHLGNRLGPGATGMLQAAFGNLPELLICLFSLKAGLVDVVRSAIVGAVLANSLLVLGLAIVVGGLKHGTQRFPSDSPRMVATLMMLAVSALTVPTLAHVLHTPAQAHEQALSATCALVLLVVFVSSIPFSLSANPAVCPPDPGAEVHERAWPIAQALVVLGAAGVAAALASEWFVDALLPATKSMGLSTGFTGLVIVAIAGNAVENVVGIRLAAQNKPDYAMSVILNSSLQVALALTPVLVLASFFIGPTPLTLVLPPLLVAVLGLTALVTMLVVVDGESIWLEGVALIGLYVMIAAAFFWG